MINLSYKTDRYDIKKLPNQSLAVTQCGLQICNSGHSYGPFLYSHYSAHFILSGKGTYTCGGKTYSLCAGQGFMIIPDMPNTYTADIDEPWKYIYANFCGADDETLVHSAGLNEDNMIFEFDLTDDMLHDLTMMHSASKDQSARGYDVTGYFLLVMSRLVKANTQRNANTNLPQHYVRRAISYIEDNYPEKITVESIAAYVGIDRTGLYRIFKKNLNISPAQFLISYRLERAKAMMEHDNLTISEIAVSTGFFDAAHFTVAFSKKYGISPGRYHTELHTAKSMRD